MEIVFATQNNNKVKEIQKILPKHIVVKSLSDLGINEDIPETNPTIAENAIQKAQYVAEKFKVNCFADDTGLEIEALNGEPGVLSARYAGEDKNSENNINLVLKNLDGVENRNARFKTVFALVVDGKCVTFEGIVEGEITMDIKGNGGFGYDPIFKPLGHNTTFAEMSLDDKNKISHRAIALNKMITFIQADLKD